MNNVPFLGSYGYVAPVLPSPSFGKRVLNSPIFWVGLILFVIGAFVYSSVRRKKNRELAHVHEEQQKTTYMKDNRWDDQNRLGIFGDEMGGF